MCWKRTLQGEEHRHGGGVLHGDERFRLLCQCQTLLLVFFFLSTNSMSSVHIREIDERVLATTTIKNLTGVLPEACQFCAAEPQLRQIVSVGRCQCALGHGGG